MKNDLVLKFNPTKEDLERINNAYNLLEELKSDFAKSGYCDIEKTILEDALLILNKVRLKNDF